MKSIIKHLILTFTLITFALPVNATIIQLDISATIRYLISATPPYSDDYVSEFVQESSLAGFTIATGDNISARLIYDTNGTEILSSVNINNPNMTSYYSLLSYQISFSGGKTIGENFATPSYLAIYDDTGSSTLFDNFYTSSSYDDNENTNKFQLPLLASSDLWDSQDIPSGLILSDFLSPDITGSFTPINGDLRLSWSATIDRMETSPVPEPSTILLLGSGLLGLGWYGWKRK